MADENASWDQRPRGNGYDESAQRISQYVWPVPLSPGNYRYALRFIFLPAPKHSPMSTTVVLFEVPRVIPGTAQSPAILNRCMALLNLASTAELHLCRA